MELEQQQAAGIEDNGKGNSLSSARQSSSTRWTPTTDQIRILKDLYYNNGVRSPTAEQIQRISAKLRQYGKIEGKNVFYWFQNHKARERQKKRLYSAADHHSSMMPIMHNNNSIISSRKNHDHDLCFNINVYNGNKLPSMNPPAAPVSAGFVSVAMERSFREYYNSMGSNNAWIGTTTHADYNNPAYSSAATQYPFLENVNNSSVNAVDHHQILSLEEDEEAPAGTETLPLFPIMGDNLKKESRDYYYFNVWQRSEEDSSSVSGARKRASLELTLNNSYSAGRLP